MTEEKKDREKVAIATLGCKVNQCESAAFHEGFAGRGFEIVAVAAGRCPSSAFIPYVGGQSTNSD